jgi:hypothetical protein
MSQPHKNLFFYYRGASPQRKYFDIAFEQQLEDNATKALIYVLEHADRKRVLAPFLHRIVGVHEENQLDAVQFVLQRVNIGHEATRKRIALCIAPEKGLLHSNKPGSSPHRLGRPDAWIWREDAFAVLVETKIRGRANVRQIRNHLNAAGWKPSSVTITPRSWSEIYDCFQHIRHGAPLDDVSKLLLNELLRYIRMIGLATATAFDFDDFAYFMLPVDDRQSTHRSLLMRKLVRFTQDLSASPSMRRIIKRYAGQGGATEKFVHPGVFKKDATSFWITLGKKERRDHCHLTIRMSEQGMSLEAFSPHRSFTKRLVRKLKLNQREFLNALKPLRRNKAYHIRLREAFYRNPSSPYKGQVVNRAVDYLEIHPSIVDLGNLGQMITEPIERRLRRTDLRPEMFVIRNFQLSELVGKTNVVNLVASAANDMGAYLQFASEL